MARPISSPVREEPPCKGCRRPEKRAGCHDKCREYGDWKSYIAKVRDRRKEYDRLPPIKIL